MPKATPVTWQTATAPQTPLQRGAFLDACVEWLVAAPLDHEAHLAPRTAASDAAGPMALPPGWGDARGGTRLGARPCTFCGHSSGATLGNPFAGTPWIFVCRSCR